MLYINWVTSLSILFIFSRSHCQPSFYPCRQKQINREQLPQHPIDVPHNCIYMWFKTESIINNTQTLMIIDEKNHGLIQINIQIWRLISKENCFRLRRIYAQWIQGQPLKNTTKTNINIVFQYVRRIAFVGQKQETSHQHTKITYKY